MESRGSDDLRLKESFEKVYDEFIDALFGVFPECKGVCAERTARTATGSAAAGRLLEEWHADMERLYPLVHKRDPAVFRARSVFLQDRLALHRKWTPRLHAQTKTAIWEFLGILCKHAQMHSVTESVTPKCLNWVIGAVQSEMAKGGSPIEIATKLAQSIMRGDVDGSVMRDMEELVTSGKIDLDALTSLGEASGLDVSALLSGSSTLALT